MMERRTQKANKHCVVFIKFLLVSTLQTHVHMISIHQTSSMIITILKIKEHTQDFFLAYISSKEKQKGSVEQAALCRSNTNGNIAMQSE
jgi:hypothetical protein